MAKEKGVSSAGSKTKKIVFWTLSIIGVLAIIFFVYIFIIMGSSDKNIEKIGSLEADYTKNYNLFSKEYAVADPTQVTSLSVLPRAKTGAEEAKKYLIITKKNIADILELVGQIKGDYSGDKLNLVNKIEECYNSESSRMNLYEEILNNDIIYFDYFDYYENYEKAVEEFTATLDSYLNNAQADDEPNLIKDINKMKTEVSAMKTYAKGAYDAIPFIFFQKRGAWADNFNQGLDLQLKYLANPNQDTLKQMNDKFDEAAKAVEGVTDTSIKEEFDKWYNEKITLKIDEADRQFNSADAACSEAADLFATAFPGNANVIKEINE